MKNFLGAVVVLFGSSALFATSTSVPIGTELELKADIVLEPNKKGVQMVLEHATFGSKTYCDLSVTPSPNKRVLPAGLVLTVTEQKDMEWKQPDLAIEQVRPQIEYIYSDRRYFPTCCTLSSRYDYRGYQLFLEQIRIRTANGFTALLSCTKNLKLETFQIEVGYTSADPSVSTGSYDRIAFYDVKSPYGGEHWGLNDFEKYFVVRQPDPEIIK